MATEGPISARIRIAATKLGARLFRNQVGHYVIDGRHITTGLGKGSPDLIGWKTIEITPGMVGRRVGIFVGIEVKAEGRRPTDEQINWLVRIRKAGGLAIVADSVEVAEIYLCDEYFGEVRGGGMDARKSNLVRG